MVRVSCQAEISIQVWQVIESFHLLAHPTPFRSNLIILHISELLQLVAWPALENPSIMTMRRSFLKCNGRLNVILVLLIRMKNVTSLVRVTVSAAALGLSLIHI